MSTRTKTPRYTPPRWLNALMRLMLRTPGLQRLVGRSTALITFTGRKTGARYTTPVSYTRRNGAVIITAHESRQWWRNIPAQPRVRLRLAGSTRTGTARVADGDEARTAFLEFLEEQPMIAKSLGVERDDDGCLSRAQAEAELRETVVIVVDLEAVGATS